MPPLNTVQRSLITLAVSQAIALPSQAATILVDTNTDTTAASTCSLRDAITAANTDLVVPGSSCTAGNGDDTITFGFPNQSTISLSSQLPTVESNITINGTAQDSLFISGNNTSRILSVDDGNLTLTDLTLINGLTSAYGGAIYSSSATLSLDFVRVSGSSAELGGGIYTEYSTATISNSTISGNNASFGGGVSSYYSTVMVSNSTISGNSVSNDGGAVDSYESTVTISNSTITRNHANNDGGGMFSFDSTTEIISSIVSGNSSDNAGAELYQFQSAVTSEYSLFGNSQLDNASAFNDFTPVASDIIATSDGGSSTALHRILGPLANNGGGALTHGLVEGSPAVDAGKNVGCPATDQRGEARPVGVNCDIGAFEGELEESFFVVPLKNGKAVIFGL